MDMDRANILYCIREARGNNEDYLLNYHIGELKQHDARAALLQNIRSAREKDDKQEIEPLIRQLKIMNVRSSRDHEQHLSNATPYRDKVTEDHTLRINVYIIDDIASKIEMKRIVLSAHTTIAELKYKFLEEMGVCKELQRWVISDSFPLDHQTLLDCDVQNNSTLTLLIRTPKEIEPKVGWTCPACTFINQASRPGCEQCASERPDSYKLPRHIAASEAQRNNDDLEEIEQFHQKEREEALKQRGRNFYHLQQLDNVDVVRNTEEFECPVCMEEIEVGEGVILRECLHFVCRECLAEIISHSETPEVKCPHLDGCSASLQDREIKALVDIDTYNDHLYRSIQTAESQEQNSFHCLTADCPGWCVFEDEVNTFDCPVCEQRNCLQCKAMHAPLNCREYQDRDINRDTQNAIDEMINARLAMRCPGCQIVIQKNGGCPNMQCAMCHHRFVWFQ